MSVVAIIPARLASTRFPRKVLASDTGWPLIRHVCERVKMCPDIGEVVVATDAAEVQGAVQGFGVRCVMTREDHPNGTSRLAEAAATLGLGPEALVVNVQGDEPEIEPGAISAAIAASRRTGAEVATIASPFTPDEDAGNPNVVKVVAGVNGLAMYFSRALIPHHRDANSPRAAAAMKHVGLYVYRAEFLNTYVMLSPTPLERTEMLEQLRVLEHGYRIAVAEFACTTQGIDTPEQYAGFVSRWRASRK
ncbi:MAG: 3-deoxy-manno-octulosonate cytidylyltransferase [Tepidisphaera sp.]|nr:3-deoxy-manno-octulosonate cytidylyltransferase [Tepidisphaera sp.]